MTHIEIEKITISGIKVGQGDKKTRTYICQKLLPSWFLFHQWIKFIKYIKLAKSKCTILISIFEEEHITRSQANTTRQTQIGFNLIF